ncbi:MAG: DUF58 domain-containing protein [Candidatus Hydrogenedentes bacterium]|nr:DUF58 domain-containing protein [Candidatus Hydrogenedentota bacterium]
MDHTLCAASAFVICTSLFHHTAMKNLFWFAIAALALGVAFLVKSPYMAYAIYAFLLLVTLAHFSSVAWLSGLDCERSISVTTLRQGEETEVEVNIANRRGWPIPWIFMEDLHPSDFPRDGDNARLAVLMPGRSISLRYKLQCPRRGYHRIGPLLMESGDLFGLQKRFRTGVRQDYISVLPTVAYIDTFNISARRPQGPVRISNRIYDDPTRISGVREYVLGDPLNRIHWKASARTGELFSKTHDPSTVVGATLVLDLRRDNYKPEKAESRMELAITTTASMAYLLQLSGEQVGLITNALDAAEVARYEVEARQSVSRDEARDSVVGEGTSERISPLQVPTRRSPIQAQQIIENLARVLPGDGLDSHDLILAEFRRLPRDAALLPVVPQVTENLALTLAEMKLSGFAVSVFLIDDRAGYPEAAALLARHQINVFHIEHERDLHEISPARIGH